MNNQGWVIAFSLSFIPLGLWISFLLFKFSMNLSMFPWVLFAIPAVPYIGFQICLATLAFDERIKGEAEKLRLAMLAFGTTITRKPTMKKYVNSMILGAKTFGSYLSTRPYLAMLARWRRRDSAFHPMRGLHERRT